MGLGIGENWGLQGQVAYPLSGKNGWLAWYRNLVSGWENAESQNCVCVDVDVECRMSNVRKKGKRKMRKTKKRRSIQYGERSSTSRYSYLGVR